MSALLHDIRNQLAVAVANIEGLRDGILEPTPARLDAVLTALENVDALLSKADVQERGQKRS